MSSNRGTVHAGRWLASAAAAMLALAAYGAEVPTLPKALTAAGDDGQVLRATLDNGLRVIIVRNYPGPRGRRPRSTTWSARMRRPRISPAWRTLRST